MYCSLAMTYHNASGVIFLEDKASSVKSICTAVSPA